MSLPLAGKVAIITGSSRNIGASIARRLARDGASVVVNYKAGAGAAQEVVDAIHAEGHGKAVALQGDMAVLADAQRLVEEGVKAFGTGKLDILCLNAGLMGSAVLADITEQDFEDHFTINVKVPLFMTKAAAQYMGPGESSSYSCSVPRWCTDNVYATGGRVFFFSTSLTKFSLTTPNYLLYAASKGAVEQTVRVLAKDLGARGITVNAIAPGPTDTDLFRNGKNEQLIQFIRNFHPQKRIAEVDEVAPIVAFLSREEAGWINGQTHFVNGVSRAQACSAVYAPRLTIASSML